MQGDGGGVVASGKVILRFHECQFMTNTAVTSLFPSLPLSLSVRPSVGLSIYPPVCQSVSASVRLSTWPSVPICQSVHLPVCTSICPPICPSVHPSIRLLVHPSSWPSSVQNHEKDGQTS